MVYVLAGFESDTSYAAPRGVEVLEPLPPSNRRSRLRRWMGRPPQVFVIGALFVVGGIWMAASPETFDNRPSSFVRGLGVVAVVFVGLATLVGFVRWWRTGRLP